MRKHAPPVAGDGENASAFLHVAAFREALLLTH